ncbi:MAG: NAD(P)H-flavin reductase [Gammaproteobacteria bacterium]|nr:NAD(P)H-flavin reductase [Gammaproteobacteria bacterium]
MEAVTIQCRISHVEDLGHQVRKLLLESGTTFPAFKAGQYLEILLPNGKKCPFSIANAPSDGSNGNTIELHIRPTPESSDSQMIEKLIDNKSNLQVVLPRGKCFLDKVPSKDLLLIAASTGITQMKSLVEYLRDNAFGHAIHLYWGVRFAEDIYLQRLCDQWRTELKSFEFIPVVSEPQRSPDWQGRKGLVGDAVLEDFDDLANALIFVSGSPAMVYATMDNFMNKRGMPEANIFSDVFDYAPRN